ncbi:MAG: serine/threonine-protein kinase [archaeon]|nr:serine/threonine-protein kinase [archaeon]
MFFYNINARKKPKKETPPEAENTKGTITGVTNFGKQLKNEKYEIEIFHNFSRQNVDENFLIFQKFEPKLSAVKPTLPKNDNPSLSPDDFEFVKVIGRFLFGKITQVKSKINGMHYSLKTIKKSKLKTEKHIQYVETERLILEELSHPFIVKLHYAFQTEAKLYLVLELYKYGDLLYYLNQNEHFTENEAKFYFAQVVLLFEYFHSKNILYRNLSPECLLLDSEGYIKVMDFSIAKSNISNTSFTKTSCGLPEYRSPEMLQGGEYGRSTDIWTMGIFLYELLYGATPFRDNNTNNLYKKIIFNSIDFSFDNIEISENAKDLIGKMLEKNYKKRIGLQEIKKHPFFSDISFEQIFLQSADSPIVPVPQGDNEFRYIDPDYLAMNPNDSFISMAGPQIKGDFDNYTYNECTELFNSVKMFK